MSTPRKPESAFLPPPRSRGRRTLLAHARWASVGTAALFTALCFTLPPVVLAQDVEDAEAEDFPSAELSAAVADEEPLELGDLEIVAEGLSFEQEFTLRMLREALDKPKSQKEEDRDEWVCWVDKATGSRLNYLNCARNGDLWALQPSDMGGGAMAIGAPIPVAGYGSIMRSSNPVNRSKLRQAMDNLNGSEEFDKEFIALTLSGERPPRDIPDDEELDQFAKAYQELGRLQRRGASEARQVGAIEKTGLSLARYNRIAELTEVYQSIENEVADRLGR